MAMAAFRVRSVPPPRTPLLDGSLRRVDFADAFRARLADGSLDDIDAIASAFVEVFTGAPLFKVPMWIRDQVVRPFGLKRSDAFKSPPPYSFRPGARSPMFKVLERRDDDEILFGEDDSHLDFRLSMLVERTGSGSFVTLTTIVQFNNWVGRAYFAIVRWGHRVIVPAMMRRALRRLAAKLERVASPV